VLEEVEPQVELRVRVQLIQRDLQQVLHRLTAVKQPETTNYRMQVYW
jgi:hypothetical protein